MGSQRGKAPLEVQRRARDTVVSRGAAPVSRLVSYEAEPPGNRIRRLHVDVVVTIAGIERRPGSRRRAAVNLRDLIWLSASALARDSGGGGANAVLMVKGRRSWLFRPCPNAA